MANNTRSTNPRSQAAYKAASTMRARRAFVDRFNEETLAVLRAIVSDNQNALASFSPRSVAAYRANLTRGTYSEYVRVNSGGEVTRDRLGLSRRR